MQMRVGSIRARYGSGRDLPHRAEDHRADLQQQINNFLAVVFTHYIFFLGTYH
jgi:hypothetical protein